MVGTGADINGRPRCDVHRQQLELPVVLFGNAALGSYPQRPRFASTPRTCNRRRLMRLETNLADYLRQRLLAMLMSMSRLQRRCDCASVRSSNQRRRGRHACLTSEPTVAVLKSRQSPDYVQSAWLAVPWGARGSMAMLVDQLPVASCRYLTRAGPRLPLDPTLFPIGVCHFGLNSGTQRILYIDAFPPSRCLCEASATGCL